MGDSSDDILLQINHVKYKKDDGQLCIASNKIGWIKQNTQNFAISIIYTDVKSEFLFVFIFLWQIELLFTK